MEKGGRYPAQEASGGRLGADHGGRQGHRPGGGGYSNECFHPPLLLVTAERPPPIRVGHTPALRTASDNSRLFTRTCVWRNLSKATTVALHGRSSRGAAATTTADSATITARYRSQGQLEPGHAMNEATKQEGPKQSPPGRPPSIPAESSGLCDRQRRVIEVIQDACSNVATRSRYGRSARPWVSPAPPRRPTS